MQAHRIAGMDSVVVSYADEQAWTASERELCYGESNVSASPLQPVATATSVRVRGGKRTVTDGPFAETREQLGGPWA
jgi:hypothetical protein